VRHQPFPAFLSVYQINDQNNKKNQEIHLPTRVFKVHAKVQDVPKKERKIFNSIFKQKKKDAKIIKKSRNSPFYFDFTK
jgi:hypothetical protein